METVVFSYDCVFFMYCSRFFFTPVGTLSHSVLLITNNSHTVALHRMWTVSCKQLLFTWHGGLSLEVWNVHPNHIPIISQRLFISFFCGGLGETLADYLGKLNFPASKYRYYSMLAFENPLLVDLQHPHIWKLITCQNSGTNTECITFSNASKLR